MQDGIKSFIGTGDLYMDRLTSGGASTGLVRVGNATKFSLKVDTESKELLGRGRSNAGQTLASVTKITATTIGLSLNQLDLATLATIFMGDKVALTGAGGSVSNETITAAIGKHVELLHGGLTNVVVRSALGGEEELIVPETGTPGENAGNGTLTGVAGRDDIKPGVYTITCIDDTISGAEVFSVVDPDSIPLANATVDSGYYNDQIEFILNDSTDDFEVGDIFTITVTGGEGIATYTVGTDYTVNARLGLIEVLSGGLISNGQTLKVNYTWAAETGYKITGATQPVVKVRLVLDGKNDYDGAAVRVDVWEANLSPSNEVDFLAPEFASLDFEGKMLTPSGKSWPFEVR
jgi:hypothetical protein